MIDNLNKVLRELHSVREMGYGGKKRHPSPLGDGNGRMSRLLMTLLLYQQGYVVGKYISIESKIQKTKSKYYEVLELWNQG